MGIEGFNQINEALRSADDMAGINVTMIPEPGEGEHVYDVTILTSPGVDAARVVKVLDSIGCLDNCGGTPDLGPARFNPRLLPVNAKLGTTQFVDTNFTRRPVAA